MFRHPRIERGNSGHGRPGDKTQPASTSPELDTEDASHTTVDSMDKTSPEAPQPGKAPAEGMVCLFCGQLLTTNGLFSHHFRHCHFGLESLRDSQLLGEHTKVGPPATRSSERSGEV